MSRATSPLRILSPSVSSYQSSSTSTSAHLLASPLPTATPYYQTRARVSAHSPVPGPVCLMISLVFQLVRQDQVVSDNTTSWSDRPNSSASSVAASLSVTSHSSASSPSLSSQASQESLNEQTRKDCRKIGKCIVTNL